MLKKITSWDNLYNKACSARTTEYRLFGILIYQVTEM